MQVTVYLSGASVEQVANPRRVRATETVESQAAATGLSGRAALVVLPQPGPARPGPCRVERSRGESSGVESSRKSPPLTSRRAHLQSALESCTTEHARASWGRLPQPSWTHAPDQHRRQASFRISFGQSKVVARSAYATGTPGRRCLRSARTSLVEHELGRVPWQPVRSARSSLKTHRCRSIMSHSHANDGHRCRRDGEPSQRRRLTFPEAWSGWRGPGGGRARAGQPVLCSVAAVVAGESVINAGEHHASNVYLRRPRLLGLVT